MRNGTRRVALLGAALGLALGIVALWATGCDNPVGVLTGLTRSSDNGTPAQQHTHRCTIPFSDINNPPSGGNTYSTTTDGNPGGTAHAHLVRITAAQLAALQSNTGSVAVTSEPAEGHTHNFIFER